MKTPYLFRLADRLQAGVARLPDAQRSRHRDFFRSRQLPSGGFSGREQDVSGEPLFEEEPQSDLYYTSFAVRGLSALAGLDDAVCRPLASWLAMNAERTTSSIEVLSWLSSVLMVQLASGIDCLEQAPANWADNVAGFLEQFRRDDGGYAKSWAGVSSSTYHSFLAALCYELIGRPIPDVPRLLTFLRDRQRPDGGFVEVAAMQHSGTNPTAAAIALLSMHDALDAQICQRTAEFLDGVRGDDGGFQANTRIPFSDTLSTFTGYLTCHEIGRPDLLPATRLRAFLQALELPTGGFLAAGWDRMADVEYSFYGLGCLALLASSQA